MSSAISRSCVWVGALAALALAAACNPLASSSAEQPLAADPFGGATYGSGIDCPRDPTGAPDCENPACRDAPDCTQCPHNGSGSPDCSDARCTSDPACGTDGTCATTEDGVPDCSDPDCAQAPGCDPTDACTTTPAGDPDCSDPDCAQAPGCDSDGSCSSDPDGSARCADPDCASDPSCAEDGQCTSNPDGSAHCDDPDCATAPACDHSCPPHDGGSADCNDPDCADEPGCGGDGVCSVDDTGASDCGDPDCAEEPACAGDGQCGQTQDGKPDCADPDCSDERSCKSDGVCEADDSGAPHCDDPDCADESACKSDGTCTHTGGTGSGDAGPPDCSDPDCDEEPACAPVDPPPAKAQTIVFPELIAVQHIRAFRWRAYVDEIVASAPWDAVVAAGGAGAIEWVATLEAMIIGLNSSANPESPWHLLSNGRELIDGVWRTGKALDAFWSSKEYRSWLQLTSNNNQRWRPEIQCKDGKLILGPNGKELQGALAHSHGYTPDPTHELFTAGEAKTGSPWNSYTVNAANDAVTWTARLEARVSRPARRASLTLLGFDAPFIYSQIKYTLRCDGSYAVEADASSFPTVTLYVDRKAYAWRGQRGIAAFLKSGSAGRLDAAGTGPTAPGAVYATFNGRGEVRDQ